MSLRKETPCDFAPHECPYNVESYGSCEYWCGAPEPADDPEIWDEDEEVETEWDDCDYEVGYDPYMGCFTDDC